MILMRRSPRLPAQISCTSTSVSQCSSLYTCIYVMQRFLTLPSVAMSATKCCELLWLQVDCCDYLSKMWVAMVTTHRAVSCCACGLLWLLYRLIYLSDIHHCGCHGYHTLEPRTAVTTSPTHITGCYGDTHGADDLHHCGQADLTTFAGTQNMVYLANTQNCGVCEDYYDKQTHRTEFWDCLHSRQTQLCMYYTCVLCNNINYVIQAILILVRKYVQEEVHAASQLWSGGQCAL